MALVDSRRQRVSMLCAMYAAQGIPWGFMTIALISYLAERGVGDKAAGDLTAIVLLPWTFKLIWAPLIDSLTIRSMGRRRPWIIGAQMMMALSLLGLISMGDLTGNLWMLGCMFFIHNCFSSLQDVCTDALAVDILPPHEQGKTNGLMWGSKLIGKAIGASAMAIAMKHWGINAAVMLQIGMLLLIMLFPLLMIERPGEKRFPWSKGAATESPTGASGVRNPMEVMAELIRAFSQTTTFVFLFFGTFGVVGWGVVEVITKTLYTQRLAWSFDQVANVSGLAVFPEMAGAILGGFLADRFGSRKIIVIGWGGYGLMAIAFGMFPSFWDERWCAAGYLLLNPGVLAMGSVGFLSMSMRISWTTAAATVFTIFMTISNVGHVLGNKFVGVLRETWSLPYESTFFVAGGLMLLPLLLLPLVNPDRIDALKHVELDGK